MPQVELVKDPERYFQLLTCQSTQVKNIQFVNDECVEVYYTRGDDFIPTSDKTNVVIAAFTTAHARLKLYSVLERLQTRVLYFDTDSVIFTSQPNEWMPPLGDYLGELQVNWMMTTISPLLSQEGQKTMPIKPRTLKQSVKCEALL